MMQPEELAAKQLARMRGMNRFYHERFFSDVRFASLAIIALFVVGAWEVQLAFLLIPPVALMAAVQTAFDASYLMFSRQYSTALEKQLNSVVGANVLVAHEMEERYLFPLDKQKVVTLASGADFTWFGYVTAFYTVLGAAAFGFGLALGWGLLTDVHVIWTFSYLAMLAVLLFSSLIVGWWWFVGGVGEKRLAAVVQTVNLRSNG